MTREENIKALLVSILGAIAGEFLDNFRDLIRQAGDLI